MAQVGEGSLSERAGFYRCDLLAFAANDRRSKPSFISYKIGSSNEVL
jgi:hypothetical protein